MMRLVVIAFATVLAWAPVQSSAQADQTLADIRQELTVLFVEIQRLKTELSTTGAPTVDTQGSSVLDRVSAIEAELQRLTAQTEELENRVNRVVADGTNRIGDLEFRLVELEGGDVSQLGQTSTLGGGEAQAPAPAPEATEPPATELAVGEQADFDTASKALADGNYAAAAEQFAKFNQTYPGSPMAAQASLLRGRALDAQGDTREAARSYLASFSGDATGPAAPEALFELGAALGRLGQKEQACLTLGEVENRFPAAPSVAQAKAEMATLGCT